MIIPDVVNGFKKLIFDEAEVDGLLGYLTQLTGSTAVFEDTNMLKISASYAEESNHERQSPYLSIKTSPGYIHNGSFPYSEIDNYTDIAINRLACEVTDGCEQIGILSLLREGAAFPEETLSILLIASEFFAINTILKKKLARNELRFTGNLIEDLIFSNNLDHDSIANRAKVLGYDIMAPHRVLVAEFDSANKTTTQSRPQFNTELVEIVQARVNCHGGGLAICRQNDLIMLCKQSKSKDGIAQTKLLAEDIVKEVERVHKSKLYIGIGSICPGLEDFKSSYHAAKKTLEIGGFMITEGQVRSFEQFKVHALFLSTIKPDELRKYAKSQLGELLDYDAAHKAELTKTLQEFLYLRNSIEKTAKSISLSVNGLKYRLKKIEQVLGKELSDYKVCFDLQLAFIIYQLFGEYRI